MGPATWNEVAWRYQRNGVAGGFGPSNSQARQRTTRDVQQFCTIPLRFLYNNDGGRPAGLINKPDAIREHGKTDSLLRVRSIFFLCYCFVFLLFFHRVKKKKKIPGTNAMVEGKRGDAKREQR